MLMRLMSSIGLVIGVSCIAATIGLAVAVAAEWSVVSGALSGRAEFSPPALAFEAAVLAVLLALLVRSVRRQPD
jgi:MFS superfamily sulfate permease-like transporter